MPNHSIRITQVIPWLIVVILAVSLGVALTRHDVSVKNQKTDKPSASNSTEPSVKEMTFQYSDGRYRGPDKDKRAADEFLNIINHGNFQRTIKADGLITTDTAYRFATFLKTNNIISGTTVVFNSVGGSVFAALQLGRLIREDSLDTRVDAPSSDVNNKTPSSIEGCFSACTFAFLGGVVRRVEKDALFGVHQVSSRGDLTVAEALQMGQLSLGEIVRYAAAMGVNSDFVYEVTRATPDTINILTPETLSDLAVTTPEMQTTWEIKSAGGGFYLLAASRHEHELNKLLISCEGGAQLLTFLVNASGGYIDDGLQFRNDYALTFANDEMELTSDEVIRKVKSGNDYIAVDIKLTPRIREELITADSVTFQMMMPSHIDFLGFQTDLKSGRVTLENFLNTCKS